MPGAFRYESSLIFLPSEKQEMREEEDEGKLRLGP
jgi:hypothetical protein